MFDFLKNLFGGEDITEKLKEGAFLVDVRSPQEYDSGHIKESVNIPVDKIQNSIEKFRNKKHIVVFCRSGNRSRMAKSILNNHGIVNVTNGGTWTSVNNILKNL